MAHTQFVTAPLGGKSGSGNGLLIFGLAIAAAAAGYYFLVYQPEQEAKEKLTSK